MTHRPRLRVATTVAITGALLIGGLTAATAAPAGAATQRALIAGTHPAWAAGPGRAVTQGTVNARIYLAGRDAAGLTAYATAVSSPGNSRYRHYLTPAQVRARYGPSRSQVAAVTAWARSAGLRVTGVNGQLAGYVDTRGPLAAASRAFGVRFAMFKAPDGRLHRAPVSSATAPAAIAGDVLTISGLDTAPHLMKAQLPPPGPNYWIAHPCARYYGQKIATGLPTAYGSAQPWTNCGYTPAQIRGAYGVSASHMTGKGQTVAVVDAYASPTMLSDANQFATDVGDAPFRTGQYSQHVDTPFTHEGTGPNGCGASGWYGEESLDVEAVHGQAPDANVRYVGAASCYQDDFAAALAYIVNNHLASIVTDSWGYLSDQVTIESVYELIFQAGAAEGIGFFFASGDNGYESPLEHSGSDKIQVTYPTSSPWVTSVGGTSLAIGRGGRYEFETAWGTLLDPLDSAGTAWQYPTPGKYPQYFDGAGGGGVSTQYTQPFYQRGVVPGSLSHRLPTGGQSPVAMRVVPDLSALADASTGMLVGQTTLQPDGTSYAFSLSRIGGTSVACPVLAGIEADAQQAAGYPLGFADPVIDARYGSSAFHDVTATPAGPGVHLAEVRSNYSNPYTRQGPLVTYLRTLGIDGEGPAALRATVGYDDATGVGSPARYIQSFEP
jgi:subtilase family serine protease